MTHHLRRSGHYVAFCTVDRLTQPVLRLILAQLW
jgi:hypothetical protein